METRDLLRQQATPSCGPPSSLASDSQLQPASTAAREGSPDEVERDAEHAEQHGPVWRGGKRWDSRPSCPHLPTWAGTG